jgi:hypothetical protein
MLLFMAGLKGEVMKRPRQRKRIGTGLGGLIRSVADLVLLVLAVTLVCPPAVAQGGTTTIIPGGSVVVGNGTVVPPFPQPGRWTEFETKSSDRYEIRHFRYMVPNESPAIELFVTTDKRDESPDGVFEMGLVQGFVKGFASNTGFTPEMPVFRERSIGTAKTLAASIKLSNGTRTLRVYAYVYPRKPSLTFITITAREGVEEGIETYLARVDLR